MREIFTNKGYKNGSVYDRNGIKCTLSTEPTRPFYFDITTEGQTSHYQEISGVIKETDEDYTVKDIQPSPEVLANIPSLIAERINLDAVDLGLTEPEMAHDREVTYLKLWKLDLEGRGAVVSAEEVNKKFADLAQFDRTEIIALTNALLSEMLFNEQLGEANRGDYNDHQVEYVRQWIEEEAENEQIASIEQIIEKYSEIKELREPYQLGSLYFLTPDEAWRLSMDQQEYLEEVFEDGAPGLGGDLMRELTKEEMRREYDNISHLIHRYELNSLALGLDIQQAGLVDSREEYETLLQTYLKNEGTDEKKEEAVRKLFAELHEAVNLEVEIPSGSLSPLETLRLDNVVDRGREREGESKNGGTDEEGDKEKKRKEGGDSR